MADVEECGNYSGGSLVGAIVGTFVATLVLLGLIYLVWEWQKKRRLKRSGLHNLVIVEDGGGTGSGSGEGKAFSYDNPGFMDDSTEAKKSQQGGGLDAKFSGTGKPAAQQNGSKKMPWGPLSFLFKSRSALDDSVVEEPQKYNVALKGHDFTGLGFNICGNMRDGIFVKDIMQRGPAAESKEVLPGDQITGMTVSFKQMVLEDAITLLSYASPYEVNLEMLRLPEKSLPHKGIFVSSPAHPSASSGQSNTLERVCHPFFKSQSIDDLRKVGKEHLDLQVDRKKKQANGIHAKTSGTTSGTMEIPTVVVVGNNENRSSSSPSKSTSAVKMPKLPKMSFGFGSSSSPKKAPEAHQKSSPSSSSSPSASAQIQIPMPDEVDGPKGPIVSLTKPELVPRSKVKASHVQKSAPEDMELVEAISPAIDKMAAEFEINKGQVKEVVQKLEAAASSSATAVLDVQPVEIDMTGQPSVTVETKQPTVELPKDVKVEIPTADVDVRAPSMLFNMGKSKGKEKNKKEKPEKSKGKQKAPTVDIDLTPPDITLNAGIELDGESGNKEEAAVKKPQRGQKSKDKTEKSKEKEGKASKPEKDSKEKESSEQEKQGEASTSGGEKSKFFKFGIPVLPDIGLNFGFGGSKSSEDKEKEKESKEKKEKDKKDKKEEKESSKTKEEKKEESSVSAEIIVEASAPKLEASLEKSEEKQGSPEPKPESGADSKKEGKKGKESKSPKSKDKDKAKAKEEKANKSDQPEGEDQQQAAAAPQKEKSGSSGFSFNLKLPSFDKPLLKRKDSSNSNSGETGTEPTVESHPDASETGEKDPADVKAKAEKSTTESSPSKSKKKADKAEKKAEKPEKSEKKAEKSEKSEKKVEKSEKKSSSRPTSPDASEAQRTTDDEAEKSTDVVDSMPGEKAGKKGSGFHMPHIGIKLPKFGHSKHSYSFENAADGKDLKHGHGPTAEALLEVSPSMKMEVSSNTAEFKKMTPTAEIPEVAVIVEQPQVETMKRVKDEVDSSEVKVEIEAPKVTLPSVPSASIELTAPSVKVETTEKESSPVPVAAAEEKSEVKEEVSESKASPEVEESPKKEEEGKDKESPKEKEAKPSFVSKGLKGLRDLKDKVTHRLSHDHHASSSESDGEGETVDGENKVPKEKVKKEKKIKESRDKSKEDKLREKEEKAKEKERLKAEKKLKKAELKKKQSTAQSSSSSSSSSDESDADDGTAGEKKEKKRSKTKEKPEKKKKEKKGEKSDKKSAASIVSGIEVKAELPEVEGAELTASTTIEQKQLVSGHEAKLIPAKPPVVPRKSKDSLKDDDEPSSTTAGVESAEAGVATAKTKVKKSKSKGGSTSSSSSSSSESDSENNKGDDKAGKPKKPKRTPKRKAPEIPSTPQTSSSLAIDVPDIVKITTSAEVSSPPKEDASTSQTSSDVMRESSKTPESGRRSASFGDLSTLQPKPNSGDAHLERAMSVDMGGDKEHSTESGSMPVGSSMEDLSVISDSKTITHLSRNQQQNQGLRDSIASKSSSSSCETLKASPTSVVQVHPKEQQVPKQESSQAAPTTTTISVTSEPQGQDPQSSTIQQMMTETLSVMNNIVHEMDSPSLVKAAMSSKKSTSSDNAQSPQVTISTSGSSLVDKAEAEKIARETVDEIMVKASQAVMPEMSVSVNSQEQKMVVDEPKVSVSTGDNAGNNTSLLSEIAQALSADREGGADSFSIASVKIQGTDGDGSEEPVSVRNITVTNIKNDAPKPLSGDGVVEIVSASTSSTGAEPSSSTSTIVTSTTTMQEPMSPSKAGQLLREDSKQRLLQTVADANEVKAAAAAATPLRKDSSLSSSSCSVDSSPDVRSDPIKPMFAIDSPPTPIDAAEGNGNGQTTIEITSAELDGIMMSHADFLQKQAAASTSGLNDESLDEAEQKQQLKDVFDNWVYVEQKNAAIEHTCAHSHSDPEPSTASSNDDDDGPYSRNGALSPTTYRMETEYKFETSEMRVTSSPIPPEEAQVKSQSTVYSTTMTLPQKTVTQITLGDPVMDAGGRIVSKITLDTSSQSAEEGNKSSSASNVELPKLESLK